MRVFAIDPSVNHLGWAVMDIDQDIHPVGVAHKVVASGTIDAPEEFKQENLVERLEWMAEAIEDVATDFDFDVIVIERPEPWGAYKSMASDRSGAMQMLTLLIGALAYWAIGWVSAESVKLVKVSTWKGQLPKHITKRRMEQKYGQGFKTDHEADAVGIGDYYLGVANGAKK